MTLALEGASPRGAAFVRTNIGRAPVMRDEIVAHNDEAKPFLAADWHDLPMEQVAPGRFSVRIPLVEPGVFTAKAFFLPEESETPVWPDGGNTTLKVAPAFTVCGNSIYTAFVRQFHDEEPAASDPAAIAALDRAGYTVIPPSGTFRALARRLDHIVGTLGFRIVQLLPVHPVPTTYARMGRFGSPFASLDFFSVDPALAEFDERTTPLQQFEELADAIHARGARLFIDLPANHTGWASTFQVHHPEWFERKADGSFRSPGAWGVTWADLVELDYDHPALRSAMAEVFLYWCAHGVDGFRCDAGYMIPAETWTYIMARVRQVFPETIFMLEGLGGKLETTDSLLTGSDLDWAYSELFQTENRDAFENYLPSAIDRSESIGPLVHFAETHDNSRLAARGRTYAAMRTALAALLSDQGAFGITAGVEWFCEEKIDVHGAPSLRWGAKENQVDWISRVNGLLESHPSFALGAKVELVQRGPGNLLVAIRRRPGTPDLLVVANLDPSATQRAFWPAPVFAPVSGHGFDLLSGKAVLVVNREGSASVALEPGRVLALVSERPDGYRLPRPLGGGEPPAVVRQRRARLALAVQRYLDDGQVLPRRYPTIEAASEALATDPIAFCRTASGMAHCVEWQWARDDRRVVMVPPRFLPCIRAPRPFRVLLWDDARNRIIASDSGVRLADGTYATFLFPPEVEERRELTMIVSVFSDGRAGRVRSKLLFLPEADKAVYSQAVTGAELRAEGRIAVLANERGAMAQVQSAWGTVRSQYDALLAVNPNPAVPDNRRVFFSRCRAWVRYCGYSYELDESCTESFCAEPGGHAATWRFRTPVGLGKDAELTFRLVLDPDKNRVDLQLARLFAKGETALANDHAVTLVLRPDVEARDFHGKTLAYTGPERSYPDAVRAQTDGFAFHHEGMPPCAMRLRGGLFHHEPDWSYSVGHPVDAERGLGPTGDLFSPGWFEVPLVGGETATLTAGVRDDLADAPPSARVALQPLASFRLPFEAWIDSHPEALYLARRDSLKTVIAGYPWFLDWGRDTLIVLRGLLAAGGIRDSLAILREFGRFEEKGTLPNIIHGNTVGNRDTSDAPLWYIVSVGDAMDVYGVPEVARLRCGDRSVAEVLRSIVENNLAGTPNGIHVDPDSGLLFSPSHFTWMDTNYPAGTPRQGYPVEIQALWIAALSLLRERLGIDEFQAVEKRARESLLKYYVLPEGWLADNLRTDPGTPASHAVAEDALRPNQLLAVTLGAIDPGSEIARSIVSATARLLVPGGIRSLAYRPVRVALPVHGPNGLLNDPLNPYWGHYRGDEDTRRKPAYHNGTAWGWQFPLWCEAVAKVYGEDERETALAMLASVAGSLEVGCLSQLPEIVDGDAPHTQRGCWAQAWSVSEVVRVWHKLRG